VGIGQIGWLSSPDWAIRSVILFDVWKACGYLMVYYLAGLQGIPESLYEAGKIDGANSSQLLRHVTLPLITPTAFFALIISSIGAFQIFDNAYVLTQAVRATPHAPSPCISMRWVSSASRWAMRPPSRCRCW